MNIDDVSRAASAYARSTETSHAETNLGFAAALRYPLFILLFSVLSGFIALRIQGLSVSIKPLVAQLLLPAICPTALAVLARVPRYADVARKWNLIAVSNACLSLLLVVSFGTVALVMQDLAVAYDAPLIDTTLIQWDALLGFNWLDTEHWFVAHPVAIVLARMTYPLWTWQLALLTLHFSFTKKHVEIAEFLTLFFLVTIASILISALYPAANPYYHFGFADHTTLTPWSDFYPLREGSEHLIDLNKHQGLISMPSMHAAGAVLYVYSARNLGLIFYVSLIVNVLMVAGAVFCGAHYLCDIIAGLSLSIVAIIVSAASRRIRRIESLLV